MKSLHWHENITVAVLNLICLSFTMFAYSVLVFFFYFISLFHLNLTYINLLSSIFFFFFFSFERKLKRKWNKCFVIAFNDAVFSVDMKCKSVNMHEKSIMNYYMIIFDCIVNRCCCGGGGGNNKQKKKKCYESEQRLIEYTQLSHNFIVANGDWNTLKIVREMGW